MKKTLSDMVGIWKWAAKERAFLMTRYDLIARRAGTQDDTELGEELSSQGNEAQAKQGGDRENDFFCLENKCVRKHCILRTEGEWSSGGA